MAFAAAAGVTLPKAGVLSLFFATWILYVADRLLDGRDSSRIDSLRDRHRFHASHRKIFLTVAALTLPSILILLPHIDPRPFQQDLLLSGGAGFYLLGVHCPKFRSRSSFIGARSASRQRYFVKEVAVAIIFSAACFIPTASRHPSSLRWLFAPALLFACLCALNCIAIELWERSPRQGLPSAATTHSLQIAGVILFALAIGTAMLHPHEAAILLSLSVAASTLLLLALDRNRYRMSALRLRAAADAALLTPLLVLLPFSLLPLRR